jgi:hypothetical protein
MTLSSRCFLRLITLSETRLSKTYFSPGALAKAKPNIFPRGAPCQALAPKAYDLSSNERRVVVHCTARAPSHVPKVMLEITS